MLVALGALFFLAGMRFAWLRWHELKVTERRCMEAVQRVEIATATWDATSDAVRPDSPPRLPPELPGA